MRRRVETDVPVRPGARYLPGLSMEMRRATVARHAVLLLAVLASVVTVFAWPPIPQSADYHLMADRRAFLGIPNFLAVLSNVPFAIVGLLGLAVTFGRPAGGTSPFSTPGERWPYAALFTGVTLTTFGSGYFHLAPDTGRLVWDRLPMAISFMGLLTAVVAERVSLPLARRLLGPLLLVGIGSVAYWYWTELRGAGDLRLYVLVQFDSLLLVVLMLILYPPRYAGTGYLVAGLATYAVAKAFELADHDILAFGQIVSGHTLKHLTAAVGVAFVVGMLRARTGATGARSYVRLPSPNPGAAGS